MPENKLYNSLKQSEIEQLDHKIMEALDQMEQDRVYAPMELAMELEKMPKQDLEKYLKK